MAGTLEDEPTEKQDGSERDSCYAWPVGFGHRRQLGKQL